MLRLYLIVISLVLGCAALVSVRSAVAARMRQRLAQGRITDWVGLADQDLPQLSYYYAKIAFQDELGIERAFVSRIGRARCARPVGAACLVAYDPANPDGGIEYDFASRWGWPCSLLALAGLSMISALALH
jgi:hypothetical protein